MIPWKTMTDAERCACVAENVMGGERGPIFGVGIYSGNECYPAYLSDPRAWWEVAEKIIEAQQAFNLFRWYSSVSPLFHANSGIMCDDVGCDVDCSDADRPGEAVCIAALRALGHEVDA